jgi:hypothetical protein
MGPGTGDDGVARVRSGGRVWWVLMVAVGCALVGALSTAGFASAASRQRTVHNRASHDPLVLESVTAGKDNPMEFEGRAHDGSWLLPDGQDHFELKYGANYQAVLKYSIGRSGGTVEFWVKNALDFADSRCRFVTGGQADNWAVEDHYDPPRGQHPAVLPRDALLAIGLLFRQHRYPGSAGLI